MPSLHVVALTAVDGQRGLSALLGLADSVGEIFRVGLNGPMLPARFAPQCEVERRNGRAVREERGR